MAAKRERRARVLIYNWAPFDAPDGLGGGVSVYLRNLLDVLSRRDDLELVFLSSGARYGWFDRRVRWRQTDNALSGRGVRSFEILNSPVKAPGRVMFHAVDRWRTDPVTRDVFLDFLKAHGPFDAVHVHNFEGLSSAAFAAACENCDSRFFFTWHNYIPVCPQVHLLHRERQQCEDYSNGDKCAGCVSPALFSRTSRSGGIAAGGTAPAAAGPGAPYRRWREDNVALLNDRFDGTIAVSSLARDTVLSYGVRPETLHLLPLGMDVHKSPDEMKAVWAAKPRHAAFTFSDMPTTTRGCRLSPTRLSVPTTRSCAKTRT
jgi:hypothetical protein